MCQSKTFSREIAEFGMNSMSKMSRAIPFNPEKVAAANPNWDRAWNMAISQIALTRVKRAVYRTVCEEM